MAVREVRSLTRGCCLLTVSAVDQTEGEPDGSREEKIRELKQMLQGMGLQSGGVDARKAKGRILLYRYTKQT